MGLRFSLRVKGLGFYGFRVMDYLFRGLGVWGIGFRGLIPTMESQMDNKMENAMETEFTCSIMLAYSQYSLNSVNGGYLGDYIGDYYTWRSAVRITYLVTLVISGL